MTSVPSPSSRARIFGGGLAVAPAQPILTYTGQNQFTLSNPDSTLVYTLVNCTRSGNVFTTTSSTATITAKYGRALISSAARTLYTANHGRVLYNQQQGPGDAGCGPRGTICCPEGMIADSAGNSCASGGTQGAFSSCDGIPDCDCFGVFIDFCYNYYWTDYSSSGYALLGSVWGKVV